MQEELGIKKTLFTTISDPRWNCSVKSCTAVNSNFKAINTVLKNEIDSCDNKDVLQAIGEKNNTVFNF